MIDFVAELIEPEQVAHVICHQLTVKWSSISITLSVKFVLVGRLMNRSFLMQNYVLKINYENSCSVLCKVIVHRDDGRIDLVEQCPLVPIGDYYDLIMLSAIRRSHSLPTCQ